METLTKDGDGKKDLDDSGCVQDVGPPHKQTELDDSPAGLMDLSDDVLLYILRYCCPRDLKALGFTCPRLGRLIRDRTLWTRVDARAHATGRTRMRWLLAHALSRATTELLLEGYAREARGCLGHVNRKRQEVEEEKALREREAEEKSTASTSEASGSGTSSRADGPVQIIQVDPLTRLQQLYSSGVTRPNNHNNVNTPSRFSGSPSWPEDGPVEVDPEDVVLLDGSCPGPQFTLTQCMLRQLRAHCSLTSLALQYCNINCNTTGIAHFPPTLKKLSLRGAKCYNLPLDKSFLFNIQDYLPELEYLDLSECEWLEPASLLPLSKVSTLKHLVMRDCYRLSEFVAYASLATRYGFRKLEVLDVRGSPVADSEVSALGWLPSLKELYLRPAPAVPPHHRDHSHYRDEPLPAHLELEPWEMEEPEYFKIKPQIIEPMDTRPNMTIDDIEEHIEQLRDYENNICLHGIEYNLCMEGIRPRKRRATESSTVPQKKEKTQPSCSKDQINSGSNIIVLSRTPGQNTLTQSTLSPDDILPGPSSSKTHEALRPSGSFSSKTLTEALRPSGPSNSKIHENPSPSGSKTHQNPSQSGPSSSKTHQDPSPSGPSSSKTYQNPSSSSSKTHQNPSSSSSKTHQDPSPSGPSSSKTHQTPSPSGPSKSNLSENARKREPSKKSDSDSSDDEVPSKSGASDKPAGDERNPDNEDRKVYEFVRFRQNMDPVIVRRENEGEGDGDRPRGRERDRDEENREVRPRAHVLYVNVGQQLHTVYRLSIHNEPPIFYSFAGNSHLRFRPNVGNIFYTPPTPHLDATSLVSDSAVRRFGRADVDDANYVHIGPRQGPGDPGARPNRSSLRILSITGFRNITDRSLVHLATAAPNLELIDFSETRVTHQGVENFKSLRPDCEVKYSEYIEKDE